MKQTAVEWLIENVLLQPTTKEEVEHNISIFKIAKGLEKQQIFDAYIAGAGDSVYAYREFAEDYIEDTYGKDIK